jgi:hypothetical protein
MDDGRWTMDDGLNHKGTKDTKGGTEMIIVGNGCDRHPLAKQAIGPQVIETLFHLREFFVLSVPLWFKTSVNLGELGGSWRLGGEIMRSSVVGTRRIECILTR